MSLFKEVAFPGKYRDDNAIHDLVNYITQPNKTHNEIVDGMHVADNDFAGSMVRVSERFHKNSGIRLRHFIVSFRGFYGYRRNYPYGLYVLSFGKLIGV